jgi:hypothetical protein
LVSFWTSARGTGYESPVIGCDGVGCRGASCETHVWVWLEPPP